MDPRQVEVLSSEQGTGSEWPWKASREPARQLQPCPRGAASAGPAALMSAQAAREMPAVRWVSTSSLYRDHQSGFQMAKTNSLASI